MSKFLSDVAEQLIQNQIDFEKHICVIPNKRMALFLKRHLQQKLSESVFLPEFLGTNDLLGNISDMKLVSGLDANIQLYLSYLKVADSAIDFSEYLNWGGQVLSDFNDIDLYQVDPKKLFAKAIFLALTSISF